MKTMWRVVTGLSVLTIMMSCSLKSSNQKKGDAAYRLAQKVQADQKRIQLKTAYMFYDKAIKENPGNITPTLRNRYIEVTLIRANMVLNEGAAHMEAIPLLMTDIDKYMGQDVQPELKQQYATFLVQMADSSIQKERFLDALETIDKAASVANDPTPINNKRDQLISRIVQENYDMADLEIANAKESKDPEDYIKAEFYVLTALYFDSTHEASKKLLKTLRKENLATYSAYISVIDPIPDSTVFDKVNKYDILLAVPTMSRKGSTLTSLINIYNYSYNPLRLRAQDFILVDANDKRYPGRAVRIDPEILDQEHEAKVKIIFQNPSSDIVKLEYKNGDHYSEKFFM